MRNRCRGARSARVLFPLSLAVAGGCGIAPCMVECALAERPGPGKALVRVHRPSALSGAAVDAAVWDRDEFLGVVSSGTVLQTELIPGNHLLHTRPSSFSVVADLEAGRVYDLILRPSWLHSWSGKFLVFLPVTRDGKYWDLVDGYLFEETPITLHDDIPPSTRSLVKRTKPYVRRTMESVEARLGELRERGRIPWWGKELRSTDGRLPTAFAAKDTGSAGDDGGTSATEAASHGGERRTGAATARRTALATEVAETTENGVQKRGSATTVLGAGKDFLAVSLDLTVADPLALGPAGSTPCFVAGICCNLGQADSTVYDHESDQDTETPVTGTLQTAMGYVGYGLRWSGGTEGNGLRNEFAVFYGAFAGDLGYQYTSLDGLDDDVRLTLGGPFGRLFAAGVISHRVRVTVDAFLGADMVNMFSFVLPAGLGELKVAVEFTAGSSTSLSFGWRGLDFASGALALSGPTVGLGVLF